MPWQLFVPWMKTRAAVPPKICMDHVELLHLLEQVGYMVKWIICGYMGHM